MIKLFIKLRGTILNICLIALASFFSLHETFNMYFLGDDFGFVYKMQNNLSFAWPQHQLTSIFHPFYNMFHADPAGYFAFGFVFFVISAILFYFLAKLIFAKSWHALIAALVYATAPIGIESTTMMLLYIGSYLALTSLSLILILFLKFLKTGKILYYIFSIVVLFFAFEMIAFRAFLFPVVMILFGIFFWNKKKLSIKTLIIAYVIIISLWASTFLFRAYLMETRGNTYITNLNPANAVKRFKFFLSNFKTYTLGNIYYDRLDSAFLNAIRTNPINSISPLIGTTNIIYVIPHVQIIPKLHVPLSILLIAFSTFVIFKKKKIKDDNLKKYFSSIAFIFAVVIAFFIPFPKNIMPSINHYAVYALPGYALFITSVFLILINLFSKSKNLIFKLVPFLFITAVIFLNLYNVNHYLSTYNARITYVRPFFKQLKELQPTFPTKPAIIYIQAFAKPEDDPGPAEIKWRLYDIWHGGIHGANVLFGLYYNFDASETIATPTWGEVTDYFVKNPQSIDNIYSFDYDRDGLHLTTDTTRENLRKMLPQTANP